MVLAGLGLEITEAELRRACDTTPLGTDALQAVDCARSLGFAGTAKHTLTVTELATLIANGVHPIAFVSLLPIDGFRDTPALVVIEANANAVVVYDPLAGERRLPLPTFNAAWAMRHNLAIIIEK
jgi:ABC-type bacteriocin/lantibiotic exporter with double-glycine peptidase domain